MTHSIAIVTPLGVGTINLLIAEKAQQRRVDVISLAPAHDPNLDSIAETILSVEPEVRRSIILDEVSRSTPETLRDVSEFITGYTSLHPTAETKFVWVVQSGPGIGGLKAHEALQILETVFQPGS